MMKRFIAALIAIAMLASLMPVSFADQGGQKHYNGLVGADSPAYKLKIIIQDLDVFLTFNDTDKLGKQMDLLEERLAEAEDAADENDTDAYEAATEEYLNTLNDVNGTLQSETVDSAAVEDELVPLMLHHQEIFYGLAENNTTLDIVNRTVLVNGLYIKIKNGMPFYYYNGSAYFIPPGQRKNMERNTENGIYNGSKVPPGLAKKGYENPELTIDNGSKAWPWDQIPYPTSKKNNNGNGRGNNK